MQHDTIVARQRQALSQALGHMAHEIWELLTRHWHHVPVETLEVVLLILFGGFLGCFNLQQLRERLGVQGADLYARINALTAYRWKQLLHEWCWELALTRLAEVLTKSPSTISRAQLTILLDDSLFVRLSQAMALVWKWWSGALKRVGTGHAIVGCVLRIGDEVIPLQVGVASKQGRRKRDKITVAKEILHELARRLRAAGLPSDGLRVVADAWYNDGGLQAVAVAEGLVWISEGKASFTFVVGKGHRKGTDLKQLPLTETWGGEHVHRCQATHATFGNVVVVIFADGKQTRYLIVAGRPLRAKEAVGTFRSWAQIETFWRELKTTLKALAIKLRSRDGIWAMLAVKVGTFLLGRRLVRQLRRSIHTFRNLTLGQLLRLAQRYAVTWPCIQEHFHHLTVGKASVLGNL